MWMATSIRSLFWSVTGCPLPFSKIKGANYHSILHSQSLSNSAGWWNVIKPADLDNDGDIDFVVGNLGSNSRITASKDRPAQLYVGDFENNGTVEQVISCYTEDGKAYPMVLKNDLQKHVPSIKKRFVKYTDYAGKSVQEVFPEEELKKAVVKKVTQSNTAVLWNEGNGQFTLKSLPLQAQFSPVFGIEVFDYNQDGQPDILLTGNFFDLVPEMGRYDANFGLLLQGQGKANFTVIPATQSGLRVRGQVRKMQQVRGANNQTFILLAKNNEQAQVFSLQPKK